MPEGPSIVILKELVQPYKGKKVTEVTGNSKLPIGRAADKKVTDFKSWGKHFLICFDDFTFRIHFLLFGSYLINEEKNTTPRLSLNFRQGTLNFYSCSVKILDEDPDTLYDWSADIMSDNWNPEAALEKLIARPEALVCDAVLNQDIFAGAGNIIKNEVLYRTRIHPLSTIGALPSNKLKELIHEVRNYS